MEDLNWKTGLSSEGAVDTLPAPENENLEFWKSLLANHKLRSRFIRDLEVQSILSRSTEELGHRLHEEEILPRSFAKG